MKKVFDRYHPAMDRTFALRAFNKYETEINEHFWSFKVVSEYARFIAKNEKKSDPNKPTASVFNASGPDATRIPPTVTKWLDASDELENWLRLSALVSASSYLEVYLRQAVRSALMSDPMCRFGSSRALDGIVLLKRGHELPFDDELRSITSGDWSSRIAAFKRNFGGAPAALIPHVSTLEKVRKIRNDFAHGFGRELAVPSPSELPNQKAHRLTQPNWIKYIGSLSKSAAAIDKHLSQNFIGNFELLHFYHNWRATPRHPLDKKYSEIGALRRSLKRAVSVSIDTQFCKSLIAFYSSI